MDKDDEVAIPVKVVDNTPVANLLEVAIPVRVVGGGGGGGGDVFTNNVLAVEPINEGGDNQYLINLEVQKRLEWLEDNIGDRFGRAYVWNGQNIIGIDVDAFNDVFKDTLPYFRLPNKFVNLTITVGGEVLNGCILTGSTNATGTINFGGYLNKVEKFTGTQCTNLYLDSYYATGISIDGLTLEVGSVRINSFGNGGTDPRPGQSYAIKLKDLDLPNQKALRALFCRTTITDFTDPEQFSCTARSFKNVTDIEYAFSYTNQAVEFNFDWDIVDLSRVTGYSVSTVYGIFFDTSYTKYDLDFLSRLPAGINISRLLMNSDAIDPELILTKDLAITRIESAFANTKITSIPAIWNKLTAGATSIGSCFDYCTELVNCSNLVVNDNITDINSLFENCQKLAITPADYGKFKNATNLEYAFRNTLIETFDFDVLANSDGLRMQYVCSNCNNLVKVKNTIDREFNFTANPQFDGCVNLASVDFMKINTGGINLSGCTSLTTIDLEVGLGTVSLRDCTSLVNANIVNDSSSSVTNMFNNCTSLTSITGMTWDKRTSLDNTFTGTKITTVDLSNNTVCTNITGAFKDCTNLTNVDISKMLLLTAGASAFENCNVLTQVELPVNEIYARLTNCNKMFKNCTALTTINTFGFVYVNDATEMFRDCTNLANIYIGIDEFRRVTQCSNFASLAVADASKKVTLPVGTKQIFDGINVNWATGRTVDEYT